MVCRRTLNFGPDIIIHGILIENYLNTIFLPSIVIFDV